MALKLDEYLIRNFSSTYEDIGEGFEKGQMLGQIQIFPEEILKKIGVTVKKLIFLQPTSYHYHKRTKELFKFEGEGQVILEGVEFKVNENDILWIPEGMKHKLIPPSPYGSFQRLETLIIAIPFFDPSDEYPVKE